jgi:hypothetical protein
MMSTMSRVLWACVVGLFGLSLILGACSDDYVSPSREDATLERLTANWWSWLPTFPVVDRTGWSRYSEEGDLTVVIWDFGHVSCFGYTYTYEGDGTIIRAYGGVKDTVYADIFQLHGEDFQRMNVYADAARDSFLETYF